LRRLEATGGYRALCNPIRLGRDHVALVEVKLSDTRAAALAAYNAAVLRIAEIAQGHMIAGGFDDLRKLRTAGMSGYRLVLAEKVSALPHVAATSTDVALQAVREAALAPAI